MLTRSDPTEVDWGVIYQHRDRSDYSNRNYCQVVVDLEELLRAHIKLVDSSLSIEKRLRDLVLSVREQV